MRYVKSLVIVFSLLTLTVYAEETAKEKFPKTGYVKADGVEVKAGDNANFESLCTLSKSESVKIVDSRYSWYKILLPRRAHLYVNKDYVTLTSNEKGIGFINATNVNLRAGAGTRYSIVGQISKPEKVSILSEESGWCRIEPPYGAAGWVHSNQITVSEVKEIKEEKTTKYLAAEAQKKETKSTTIKLNKDYPYTKAKGNLTIH